jgi:hypothetical protein
MRHNGRVATEQPDEELDQQVDALFAISPEQFVGARASLVKDLKAQKRKDEAAAVAAMRKPVPAVWAMNAVARSRPELVALLRTAGAEAIDAQQRVLSGGAMTDLRDAVDRRKTVIAQLVEAALQLSPTKPADLTGQLRSAFEIVSMDDMMGEVLATGRVVAVPEVGLDRSVFGFATSIGEQSLATSIGEQSLATSIGEQSRASGGSSAGKSVTPGESPADHDLESGRIAPTLKIVPSLPHEDAPDVSPTPPLGDLKSVTSDADIPSPDATITSSASTTNVAAEGQSQPEDFASQGTSVTTRTDELETARIAKAARLGAQQSADARAAADAEAAREAERTELEQRAQDKILGEQRLAEAQRVERERLVEAHLRATQALTDAQEHVTAQLEASAQTQAALAKLTADIPNLQTMLSTRSAMLIELQAEVDELREALVNEEQKKQAQQLAAAVAAQQLNAAQQLVLTASAHAKAVAAQLAEHNKLPAE